MLRYPGGKLRIMRKIDEYITRVYPDTNSDWIVCEPFTGGGGSLYNMAKDFPKWKFHINDFNPEIYGLWQFFHTASDKDFLTLYGMIEDQLATVQEYNRIFDNIPDALIDKAFRIIFLNKTSFSGFVTKNRPIGGADQSGKWKVDVYWNPDNIIKGIEKMRTILKDRILSVSCLDFGEFIRNNPSDFIYADPPYLAYGKEWYNCSFDKSDLERLRNELEGNPRWCLSIDKCKEVENLFESYNNLELLIKHTAKSSYKSQADIKSIPTAKELMVFPKNTKIIIENTLF